MAAYFVRWDFSLPGEHCHDAAADDFARDIDFSDWSPHWVSGP
jgi:hypothetical protein